jgi:hypothetical protein
MRIGITNGGIKLNESITSKEFWKATGIRCARSFISVVLGAQAGSNLITEIDWKSTLILATSTTFWIFLACILAGLPEVKMSEHIYMDAEEPLDSWLDDYEVFDYGDEFNIPSEVEDGEE